MLEILEVSCLKFLSEKNNWLEESAIADSRAPAADGALLDLRLLFWGFIEAHRTPLGIALQQCFGDGGGRNSARDLSRLELQLSVTLSLRLFYYPAFIFLING